MQSVHHLQQRGEAYSNPQLSIGRLPHRGSSARAGGTSVCKQGRESQRSANRLKPTGAPAGEAPKWSPLGPTNPRLDLANLPAVWVAVSLSSVTRARSCLRLEPCLPKEAMMKYLSQMWTVLTFGEDVVTLPYQELVIFASQSQTRHPACTKCMQRFDFTLKKIAINCRALKSLSQLRRSSKAAVCVSI